MNAFKVLLSDPGEWRASLGSLSFSQLNAFEVGDLEKSFLEKEVTLA